jgi:hypothetical protein
LKFSEVPPPPPEAPEAEAMLNSAEILQTSKINENHLKSQKVCWRFLKINKLVRRMKIDSQSSQDLSRHIGYI